MNVRPEKKVKKIWQGAFILTIAGLVTKILSAVYRVPYQNIAGDIGFYIYQQVYPFYGIALGLCTYGFPVVISKLLAEKYEQHDHRGALQILLVSLLFLLGFGIFSFSFLYYEAEEISIFMGDPHLASLIKIISFSFLLLPFISICRGYYQGRGNMIPTAVSQVFEQLLRVGSILVLTYLLLSNGFGIYKAAEGAIFGSIVGGLASIAVLAVYWFQKRDKQVKYRLPLNFKNSGSIFKVLFLQGFTICVSGLLLVVIQLVDALSLYSLLISGGFEENAAKTAKGIYDRGQPLIQLGTVVATSLSLSLVPLISSAMVRDDQKFIREKTSISLRISLAVGIGAAVGLFCIIEPANKMLFRNTGGSEILAVLGLSIIFTSIALTTSAILQGLGYSYLPALSVLAGVLIKWILNKELVPEYHTMGAAASTVAAYGAISFVQLIFLYIKLKSPLIPWRAVWSIFLAGAGMTLALVVYIKTTDWMFHSVNEQRLFAVLQAMSSAMLGGVAYLIIMIKSRLFTPEELSLIPLGDKMLFFIEPNKYR